MAITKTIKLEKVEVIPAIDTTAAASSNAKHPTVLATYTFTVNDSEDSDLPIVGNKIKELTKFVSDGGAATDYSSEDSVVKQVCGAIWD